MNSRLERTRNCNLEDTGKILVQVVEEMGFLDLVLKKTSRALQLMKTEVQSSRFGCWLCARRWARCAPRFVLEEILVSFIVQDTLQSSQIESKRKQEP